MTNSYLYQGEVFHRRLSPMEHHFAYSIYYFYLDLAELDSFFKRSWFCSTSRWSPIRFKRTDYLGEPEVSLEQAVRQAALDEKEFS
ncbi:MAG: DUF1365 family protein [Planctomycetaceae bacterium]